MSSLYHLCKIESGKSNLSYMNCVHGFESVFETHPKLLKFAIAEIESANAMEGLRAGACNILKADVTNGQPYA